MQPTILSSVSEVVPSMTSSWIGITCLTIFALAYTVVIFEEQLHIRKSKPVLLAASLIWILIAFTANSETLPDIEHAIRHDFLEYAELFFFLLVAMTYINAMVERKVFDALRSKLLSRGLGFNALFWITGCLAFVLSPLIDNLTTSLILCAVVLAVGKGEPKFIAIACVNIVVAANAGGAFSPFGDITTLMVWQKGVVEFWTFFKLVVPSLVNYLVPAMIMSFALPKGRPAHANTHEEAQVLYGGGVITALFALTIVITVSLHNFFHLPPAFGMMTGLALLKFYGFYLRKKNEQWSGETESPPGSKDDPLNFDVFEKIARAEWDTLFFFYGVIMAVGGLGYLGYLQLASSLLYVELGATYANVLVGVLSAIVDNIPVMFAVLTMNPDMPQVQWLLVTLTAGVGGSLLSIGSAAGVALMGQARGYYTFFSHLKWTPVIALGYAASIWVHFLVNG